MRAQEFIAEWQEADLYHVTSIPAMLSMWRQDRLGRGNEDVSTTRNYNYALGYLRASRIPGGVIFTLDQDLLRRDIGRRRMPGHDWFQGEPPEDSSDEFQRRSDFHDTDRFETLILNGLKPFKKYVKKIEIWLPVKRTPKPLQPGENLGRRAFYSGDDPDKYNDLSVYTELMQNNWFRDPENKTAWDQILADPRTDLKKELGYPIKRHNVAIQPRYQYGTDHPMYDPEKDESSIEYRGR